MKQKKEEKMKKVEKNITFKSFKKKKFALSDGENDDDDDDEVVLVTRQYKRYLLGNKKKTGNFCNVKWRKKAANEENVKRYNCDKKGHVKKDCPLLNKGEHKFKDNEINSFKKFQRRAMYVGKGTLGVSEDEETSSDDESKKDQPCFMAGVTPHDPLYGSREIRNK